MSLTGFQPTYCLLGLLTDVYVDKCDTSRIPAVSIKSFTSFKDSVPVYTSNWNAAPGG
jgi:hypothetical protein